MDINNFSKCSITKLVGYYNIYSLNGYCLPDDKDCYNKYLPLSWVKEQINRKYIPFVSPNMWDDGFEKRYYKPGGYVCKIANFTIPSIYCLCLTSRQSLNEDAMWRMYAKEKEQMVRAYYNIKDLLDILDNVSRQCKFKVYIGEVIYADKSAIKALTPSKNKIFFPSNFRLENYLSLMLVKRNAFSYENEVRFFVVPDEVGVEDHCFVHLGVVAIKHNTNNSYISQIHISPYPPTRSKWPGSRGDKTMTRIRRTIEKRMATSNITVKCSRFHENCPKCKF